MERVIPPWTYTTQNGEPVVLLGDDAYPVDPRKPPAFFLPNYLERRLPDGWQAESASDPAHPIANWLSAFRRFLVRFEGRGRSGEFRDLLDAGSIALLLLAYDTYFLDANRSLQESLLRRLVDRDSFQGALHELAVAATMIRAAFTITFEDESDSSRKHPEFIATHRRTNAAIAVEAKSIHRRGVLGFTGGKQPPTTSTASTHKVAAQICGQVQDALPKAQGLPLFVVVDLNLPAAVAEIHAPELMREFEWILPKVDPEWDDHGIRVGRTMNLLAVTNCPIHLGEIKHRRGHTLNLFVTPDKNTCRHPAALEVISDVKAALKNYGTVPGAF